MITPTWDTLLMFMLGGFVILGFVLRKSKAAVLLVAIYIALTVANEIGLELFRFIKKAEIGGFDTSLFMVKLAIFAFLAFLIFVEGELISSNEGGGGASQSIFGGIFGFLAGGIVITSMIRFMGAQDQVGLLAKSVVARSLDPFRVWFLVPFPFYLAISSLIKRFK